MTALLLLICQGAVLAPGAVAAHAAQAMSAGESHRVVQATMPAAKGIPAEVVQWFDGMKEAADKGDGAKALQMHEKVMAWVQANLPEKHLFRARVMVRYGYVLDKIGKYQEALTSTQNGTRILRELSIGDKDPEIKFFLTVALFNLGVRHARLEQMQLAIASFQEALPHARELVKTREENRMLLVDFLWQLGTIYLKLKKYEQALNMFNEALTISQNDTSAKSNAMRVVAIQVKIGNCLKFLDRFNEAEVVFLRVLPLLREQIKTGTDLRRELASSLWLMGDIYKHNERNDQALEAYKESFAVYRELTKTDPSLLTSTALILESIAKLYKKQGQLIRAGETYSDLLPRLKTLTALDKGEAQWLATTVFDATLLYNKLGHKMKVHDTFRIYLPAMREFSKTNDIPTKLFAHLLLMSSANHFDLSAWSDCLSASKEAVSLLRNENTQDTSIQGLLGSGLAFEGMTYNILGRPRQGLMSSREAVSILTKLAISTDISTDKWKLFRALALVSLSENYLKMSKYTQAIDASESARAFLRKFATDQSDQPSKLFLSYNLLSAGLSHLALSNWEKAIIPSQEAAIILREIDKISPGNKTVLSQLALAQFIVGFGKALSDPSVQMLDSMQEAERIIRIASKGDPSNQGMLALTLLGLGIQHSILGGRQEGFLATRESLAILRTLPTIAPGMQHVLAMSLIVNSVQLSQIGRHHDALATGLELVRLSRDLSRLDPTNNLLASGLITSASIYNDLKNYKKSLAYAKEALAISRSHFADSDPKSLASNALVLIGHALAQQGSRRAGIELTQNSINLLRTPFRSSIFARNELAFALNQLATLQLLEGQVLQAEVNAGEAVEIDRHLSGISSDGLERLSQSSITLAEVLISKGHPAAAIPLLRESVSSDVHFLQKQLPLMPEGRRQALVDTLGRRWEIPYSLAQQGEAGASLALYTRLNRHGPLQDIERSQALISRSNGATQILVNRLTILNGQISNPIFTAQARQNALAESELLQEELHRQLPALQPRLVEIAEVAKQLPADAVLVEFQRFSPYNVAKPEKEAWGKPRYLALLLDRRGTSRAVDLGEADALDQAIASALDRTRFQQPNADPAWGLVAERVFTPLQSTLEGKRQLLLSPDGQLHRVPFNALALLAGNTPSLPADLTIHIIGSGRDLVTASAQPTPTSAPLVLANPATKGWAPLVRAAAEGQSVASALGAQPLLGPAASVAVVERARGPRVLHIAGHGYFDSQATGDPLLASGLALAGADKARQPSRPSSPPPPSPISTSTPLPTPSASSRSTALEPVPADDGYLTAKEAARLQLDGTTLVVLSSCESGLGSERSGEGLFGLRRALTVAGARGTLLSLWKVPEHATETFMTRFYALLGQGVPPAEAVRRVQAEFRSQPRIAGWSDPFYWAGWQYSGLPDPAR